MIDGIVELSDWAANYLTTRKNNNRSIIFYLKSIKNKNEEWFRKV
jgi:hypothetical protein